VTGRRSRRARGSNPSLAYGFCRDGRHLDSLEGATFREVASKKSLGRCEELPGRPGQVVSCAGDPGARGSTRRARAIVKSARLPSSSAPARDLLRPRKWNATVKAGTCGSRLAGSGCGNAPMKSTQPASSSCRVGAGSSEAKASLACEDRRLVGVSARRIRLQKSANDAEVQRSVTSLGKGARGREPKLHGDRKSSAE